MDFESGNFSLKLKVELITVPSKYTVHCYLISGASRAVEVATVPAVMSPLIDGEPDLAVLAAVCGVILTNEKTVLLS